MPELVHVEFDWSNEHGECYDCGLPAAYKLKHIGLDNHQDFVLCSVCAAYHASHGDEIVYLFDEEEPCYWIVNNAAEPAWCCNTHMYDGTGDFPATGNHPETCPFREEEE